MKRNHLALFMLSILFMGYGLAQNTSNNFFIIPEETNESEVLQAVRNVSSG
jgi:hypothetical protein